MNRKNQLLLVSLMLITLSSVLLNARSAEYSEDLNNTWVDGNRDEHYSLMNATGNHSIYFSHSVLRYAFFIESNESITTIQVNEIILTENLSTQETNAVFSVNSAEIVFTRESMGENIHFSIRINGGDEIIVDPFSTLTPGAEPDPDPEPSSGGIEIDLVAFFGNVFSSPFFWAFLTYIVLVLADYNNHPVVKVSNFDGKKVKLGKFITETDEPRLNKKKFLFLNSDGVQEVYCNTTFRALDRFNYQHVYVIEWDYPHVLKTKLKVPESSGLKKKEFTKSLKNKFIWIAFTILRMTPFRPITLKLYNTLEYKEVPVKEVVYLIPFVSMESIEYKFDITYEQEELNNETEKTEKMELVKKKQEDIIWADILALKRGNIENLTITLAKVDNIVYPTLEAAQTDKRSRFETVNSYENRTTALEVQIFDLERRLQNAYHTIQKQRLERDEKIREGIRPLEESNEYLSNNFPDMLAQALMFRSLGFSEQQSIEKAILKHLDKQDTSKSELQKKLNKSEAELEKYAKMKADFNPNKITITEA